MINAHGPYLSFAVFCDDVSQDAEDRLTLTRVTSRTYGTPASSPEVSGIVVRYMVVLGFARGEFTGEGRLEVRPPEAISEAGVRDTLGFRPEDRTLVYQYELSALFPSPGVYWFEVLFDDALVTRMPLEIHARPATPQAT